MKKLTWIAILSLSLIMLSCIPQLYVPDSADALQQQQLMAGRKIYIKHCNHCHNLYLPHLFTPQQWEKTLDKMQPRAKVTDQEKLIILNYLVSYPSNK